MNSDTQSQISPGKTPKDTSPSAPKDEQDFDLSSLLEMAKQAAKGAEQELAKTR